MKFFTKKTFCASLVVLLALTTGIVAFAAGENAEPISNFYATFWALVPPLVAIALALITKEVYS